MHGYEWDYLPARLHTTKEIIYFLENIENIEKAIQSHPSELTNCIFGDIYYPTVIDESKKFIHNIQKQDTRKNIRKIILEITSRKVMYYNDTPLNYYYAVHYSIANHFNNVTEKILTDTEIDSDLAHIVKLCKQVFDENIELHVIPHLSLKTKLKNDYIVDRHQLVNLLEESCERHSIKMHNIGKFIETTKSSENVFLEDYMLDYTHYETPTEKYTTNYKIIKGFIIRQIYGGGGGGDNDRIEEEQHSHVVL
jgi:hypothetical protein